MSAEQSRDRSSFWASMISPSPVPPPADQNARNGAGSSRVFPCRTGNGLSRPGGEGEPVDQPVGPRRPGRGPDRDKLRIGVRQRPWPRPCAKKPTRQSPFCDLLVAGRQDETRDCDGASMKRRRSLAMAVQTPSPFSISNRKIDPSRRRATALKPDGSPNDNDRVEIGPTQLRLRRMGGARSDAAASRHDASPSARPDPRAAQIARLWRDRVVRSPQHPLRDRFDEYAALDGP